MKNNSYVRYLLFANLASKLRLMQHRNPWLYNVEVHIDNSLHQVLRMEAYGYTYQALLKGWREVSI